MSAPPRARDRILAWGGFLALILVAPLVLRGGYFLSLLCQVGIMTIYALSYDMLLGQTGLLSFGHAVYYGIGGFGAIHALALVNRGALPFPVTLLPLVGGASGLLCGLVLGYVTARRAGTTFAMISLGVGEMVAASSLMFPALFGGEGGVSGNRVTGKGWLGVTYGPQIQVYYLIAGWAFACAVAIHALAQTPLGRMANAVRDNPERAQFVGYSPQWVRYLMVVLAGFFAGVAGGLSALNYEIVTAEALDARTSGTAVLMAYVGGTGHFAGPILGAALVTVLQIAVAGVTKAWPFYFGLFFVLMVLYAPGGIAGVLAQHRSAWRAGLLGRLVPAYLRAAPALALLAAAVIALVEMAYALVERAESGGARLRLLGLPIDAGRAAWWAAAAGAAAAGLALLRRTWPEIDRRWQDVHAALREEER